MSESLFDFSVTKLDGEKVVKGFLKKKKIKNSEILQKFYQGADFKNNQITIQLNNFYFDQYRKVETKLYLLPIGPDRIV